MTRYRAVISPPSLRRDWGNYTIYLIDDDLPQWTGQPRWYWAFSRAHAERHAAKKIARREEADLLGRTFWTIPPTQYNNTANEENR